MSSGSPRRPRSTAGWRVAGWRVAGCRVAGGGEISATQWADGYDCGWNPRSLESVVPAVDGLHVPNSPRFRELAALRRCLSGQFACKKQQVDLEYRSVSKQLSTTCCHNTS